MPIGDIRAPLNRRLTSSASVGTGAFGAGTARALGNLARAQGNLIASAGQVVEMAQERQDKQDDFETQRRWIEYNGQQDQLQSLRIRGASETRTPQGLADRTLAEIEESNAAFLASVPERLRGEYSVRLEQLTNAKVNGAFTFEYEEGNRIFLQDTEQTVNDLSTRIRNGDISADRGIQEINDLIDASDLPDITRQELRVQALNQFRSIEFETEMGVAMRGGGTVRAATGEDVVAAGILPHERGLLNAISRPESGGNYNIRFGGVGSPGVEFTDFSDHPRVFERTEDGELSSAAGRYQITATTWDEYAPLVGATDFSPANQDRVAIAIARDRYNSQRAGGLTFDQALQSGDPAIILSVKNTLDDTWIGFRNLSDDAFLNITQGSQGIAGGGTGSGMFPDIWTDERFAGVTFDQKVALSNAAQQAEQDRMEAERERLAELHQSAVDAANFAAVQGQLTEADVDRLIGEGTLADAQEVSNFRRFARQGAERTQGAAAVQQQLTNPNYVFTGNDMDNMNAYIGDSGIGQLSERSEDYASGQFVPFVSRTGIVPSNAGRVLSQQLASTNPQQAGFALGVLGDIYSQNPSTIERMQNLSRQQKDDVALFAANRQFTTPEEALSLLQQRRDPNQRQALELLANDGGDAFDDVSDRTLLNAFDPSIFVRGADFPASTGQQLLFRADARNIFIQGYQLFQGDEGAALDYMNERLRLEWGTTEIGAGRRLVKNGPERYYPQLDQSHSWIDFNVREELGLGEDAEFQLVADDQTVFEGQRFGVGEGETNASYMVALRGPQDRFELVLRDDGQPRRIAFEITDLQRELNVAKAEGANLDARIRELNRQWVLTEGVGPQADALEEQIGRLTEQRRALRNNTQVVTGSDEPFSQINSIDRQLQDNRERQAEVNRQLDFGFLPGGNISPETLRGLEEELRTLQEEQRRLEERARGEQ